MPSNQGHTQAPDLLCAKIEAVAQRRCAVHGLKPCLQDKFVDTQHADLVFLEYSLNDGYVVSWALVDYSGAGLSTLCVVRSTPMGSTPLHCMYPVHSGAQLNLVLSN